MNTRLFIWLPLLAVALMSFNRNNKPSPSDHELIIAFEEISDKQFGDLEIILSSLTGIEQVGLCERMNIFYFTYDSSVYPSAEEAFEALLPKTKTYKPLLKVGSSIADVQTECNK